MNRKWIFSLCAVAAICISCVGTGDGRKTMAVPFVRDSHAAMYERSVSQVHDAAKSVMLDNGIIVRDSAVLNVTNTVWAVEGKVDNRKVWIRVEELEPRLSSVQVQARTKMGGTDLPLVHELEKQIALKLSR